MIQSLVVFVDTRVVVLQLIIVEILVGLDILDDEEIEITQLYTNGALAMVCTCSSAGGGP